MRFFFLFIFFTVQFSVYGQDNSSPVKPVRDPFKNIGYFNITKFSAAKIMSVEQDLFIEGAGNFTTELDDEKAMAYSISTINGYFFSPYFSLGLGFGIEGFNNPNVNTLPVYIDLRTYFADQGDSPYLFLNLGTLIKIDDQFARGGLFNIGGGYKFFLGEKLALVTDLSFSSRGISLTDESVQTSDNNLKIQGVVLSLGFIF